MFEAFSSAVDRFTAKPIAFVLACGVVFVWAITGPTFNFSDTWQLVINTGTTVVTFLMVFLLANSSARQTSRHYHLTEKIESLEEQITALEEDHSLKLDYIISKLGVK